MTDDWRRAAAAREGAVRASWRDTFLASGVGAVLLAGAWVTGPGVARAGLVVAGALALVAGTVIGTVVYLRRVDEQERLANLWGCYVGMCVYLVLFAAEQIALAFGVAVPEGDRVIFLVTMVTVLGVYAWRRFR